MEGDFLSMPWEERAGARLPLNMKVQKVANGAKHMAGFR
jgi:hypothetical protein